MAKRTIVLLCVFCVAFSVPAIAQDYSKAEGFLGYSYIRFKEGFTDGGGNAVTVHVNLNGGVGALTFNATKSLGIVAEIGGYSYSKITAEQAGSGSQTLNVSAKNISYLFGPRFSFRTERITPFAQLLFGGVHSSDITGSGNPPCPTAASCTALGSVGAFALALGGGLDVKAAKHISIRLGQVEYLLTRFPTFDGTGVRSSQNNFRYSAGIVLH